MTNQMTNQTNSTNNSIGSIAIVRSDDIQKVKNAIFDMIRYANLTITEKIIRIDPEFADNIIVQVMGTRIMTKCKAAAMVPIAEDASRAINGIIRTHPPAHIGIVSPRYAIFDDLVVQIVSGIGEQILKNIKEQQINVTSRQ